MSRLGEVTPVLRIFYEARARERYLGFLGCAVAWGHRLADDLPAVVLAAAALLAAVGPARAQDELAAERAEMIRVIDDHARTTAELLGRPHIDPAVLGVMGRLPRHRFVPGDLRRSAYQDRPLPIGHGQTISQPFIVALMTDLLGTEPGDRVLEIGTGSGYQAAVLAPLAAEVCSIEIIPELGERAAGVLRALGFGNVRTRVGDGYYGWPECGPFDGIVVTAAAGQVPPPLIEQLKPGGRMVIPVGGPFVVQHLMLVDKLTEGGIRTRQTIPVSFVPLTRN